MKNRIICTLLALFSLLAAHPTWALSWAQQAYVKPSLIDTNDNFGGKVAIQGNTMIVSAPYEASTAAGGPANNGAPGAGAVFVYERSCSNCQWAQTAMLKAQNADPNDIFGVSLALDGDWLVIGATNEASNATGVDQSASNNSVLSAGAAYIFRRTAGVWSQYAYLKASNTKQLNYFGKSVAISGNTVVVGADYENSLFPNNQADNTGFLVGAAYVFTYDPMIGNWSQQAYLKASDLANSDSFGYSVSIDGDTIVVGAPTKRAGADLSAGAAYVYTRTGTTWTEQAKLVSSSLFKDERFGYAVSVSGSSIAIGAPGQGTPYNVNDNCAQRVAGLRALDAGAVFIFTRSGSAWTQQTCLKDVDRTTQFGVSLQLLGNDLIVGSGKGYQLATGVNPFSTDPTLNQFPHATLYRRAGSAWSVVTTFQAANEDDGDAFAFAVGISGNTVVAGAPGEASSVGGINSTPNNSAPSAGAAYVFIYSDYTVGGTLSGLAPGNTVQLQLNGANTLSLNTNGTFTFSPLLNAGDPYAVTVSTQPSGQNCTVTQGSGNIPAAPVTNVVVTCVTNGYTVTGSVSPMIGGTINCSPALVSAGGNASCTATPAMGYAFSNWTGDCTGVGACNMTNIQANKAVTANFAALPPGNFSISGVANPPAAGSVTCTPASVAAGSNAACSVNINAGYLFTGWSGDCSGNGACNLTNIMANKVVTANFTPIVIAAAPIKPVPTLNHAALALLVSLLALLAFRQRI
jgi:uncharacterized repeat protein (TIGR02543 family)